MPGIRVQGNVTTSTMAGEASVTDEAKRGAKGENGAAVKPRGEKPGLGAGGQH